MAYGLQLSTSSLEQCASLPAKDIHPYQVTEDVVNGDVEAHRTTAGSKNDDVRTPLLRVDQLKLPGDTRTVLGPDGDVGWAQNVLTGLAVHPAEATAQGFVTIHQRFGYLHHARYRSTLQMHGHMHDMYSQQLMRQGQLESMPLRAAQRVTVAL